MLKRAREPAREESDSLDTSELEDVIQAAIREKRKRLTEQLLQRAKAAAKTVPASVSTYLAEDIVVKPTPSTPITSNSPALPT
jgi:pyruvate dehydrogenase complex dehydrogenase (E1) component